MSAPLRQALSWRGFASAVGVPRHQKIYSRDVGLVFPVATRGRHRNRLVPDVLLIGARTCGPKRSGARSVGARAAEGPLRCCPSARRRRAAAADRRQRHAPYAGRRGLAFGQRRASGEQEYYLANLRPTPTSGRSPRRSSRARSASRLICLDCTLTQATTLCQERWNRAQDGCSDADTGSRTSSSFTSSLRPSGSKCPRSIVWSASGPGFLMRNQAT